MDFKVILTPQAIEDLREIVTFIASDNPAKAEEFGCALCQKTVPLGAHPFLGRVVPEFRRHDVRQLIYRIVYYVNEMSKAVHIVHFWHGARGTPELPQEYE